MARILKLLFLAAAVLVIAGAVVVRGINFRTRAAAVVRQETLDQAVPSVAVIHPKLGAMKDEVVLPGNIQAFTDSPIYARTSGYLTKWYFDIGARVKSGQLLAEIESPEVDQQLAQARADLGTAQANLKLAELTMVRYQNLLKLEAIAKQDVDNAVGAWEADKATVASQMANVKRLEQLVSFEKVFAPFDGVITARNTDIGALVNAGNGGAAQELFHLASTDKLRVFVSVPQAYSRSAIPGVTAELTVNEFPGQRFRGKLVRNAESINAATRTLLSEVDLDNPMGRLLPGAFAEVHLKLQAEEPALVLPVTALVFRAEGMQVAVIRPSERGGDKVDLVAVTLGRDFGTEIEVTSGITARDSVIVSPPDSLTSGQQVRVEPAGGEKP
jgi:RND family efflux transporter MFP subunit